MIALLAPATLLASRVTLQARYVPGAGGARVPISIPVLYLLPVVAASVVLLVDADTLRRIIRTPWAWVGFACVAYDTAVRLGSGLTERSLKLAALLTLPYLASLASLAVGAFLWRRRPEAVHWLVSGSVIASALAGVLQMAERYGLPTVLGRWLVAWDALAAQQMRTPLNPSRAAGFELNPNVYAPMAVVGLVWALFCMKPGFLRSVTVVASMVIVVSSQSRTALMVMAAVALVALVMHLRESGWRLRFAAVAKVAAGLALAAVALVGLRYGPATIGPEGVVVQSSRGVEIPAAAYDQSFVDRVTSWKTTARAIASHPWGAGEDYKLYSAPLPHPHNEALFRLIYAGPLWLVVHMVFIAWLALWLRPPEYRWIGIALAVVLLVQGLTEVLFTMRPYMVLLYLIIGAMMWARTGGEPAVT